MAEQACNDCWDEAFRRSQIGGGHQAEHYEALLLLPPEDRMWCSFARAVLGKCATCGGRGVWMDNPCADCSGGEDRG